MNESSIYFSFLISIIMPIILVIIVRRINIIEDDENFNLESKWNDFRN